MPLCFLCLPSPPRPDVPTKSPMPADRDIEPIQPREAPDPTTRLRKELDEPGLRAVVAEFTPILIPLAPPRRLQVLDIVRLLAKVPAAIGVVVKILQAIVAIKGSPMSTTTPSNKPVWIAGIVAALASIAALAGFDIPPEVLSVLGDIIWFVVGIVSGVAAVVKWLSNRKKKAEIEGDESPG